MDKKLYEALKTIQEHCSSNIGCAGCPLDVEPEEDGYIGCFNLAPADWNIEHFEQEVSE